MTGPILDDCDSHEVSGVVTRTSDTTLEGTAPTTRVLADAAVLVAVDFPDGTVTSAGPIATFLGTPDPDVDQDGNGLRDGCDPRTYDFEHDVPGGRPADVTQLGFPTTLEVAEVDGDRVARYAGDDQVDRISYETPRHSLMLSFARTLQQATGVPVALVPASLSGTNLRTQWQRNATRPDWRATLYGSMLHRTRVAAGGRRPAGLLWFQGGSDVGACDAATYEALLAQLVQQIRDDLAAPELVVLVAQLGTCSTADLDRWLEVQEAQRRVARADENAALVTTVDQPRADWIHFSVAGYQEIGYRFAQAVRFLCHGHAIDPLTELAAASAGGLPDQIVLTYDAPVYGGEASLFSVHDDAGALTVTNVQTSGATVTLTLERVPSGGVVVTYGRSLTPTAAWIEDENGVPVPSFADVPVGGV